MPCGNEWFWLYWAHKKGAQYSVIKAKPDTRRKEQLTGNISLISVMNIFSVSIQIVEHFDGAVLSHFFPSIFSLLRLFIEDDTTRWWDNVATQVNWFLLIFVSRCKLLDRINTFGSFLKLVHFLFQHSFLFYWIQHIY